MTPRGGSKRLDSVWLVFVRGSEAAYISGAYWKLRDARREFDRLYSYDPTLRISLTRYDRAKPPRAPRRKR